MPDYKGMRYRVAVNTNGKRVVPDFNSLSAVTDAAPNWKVYFALFGEVFHDQSSQIYEEHPHSPRNTQWFLVLAPGVFVDQAKALPLCTALTEGQFQNNYNDYIGAGEHADNVDERLLNGLTAQINLILALQGIGDSTAKLDARLNQLYQQAKAALNPDDDEPGVIKNPKKSWADYKAWKGITYLAP